LDPTDGLILIYARLRRADLRDDFWLHIENLPGERVTPTIYQMSIADWDEGLWKEEIEWISELLAGSRESVIVWQFDDGKYCRYSVGGNA